MKIRRENLEIELTDEELEEAYREQQHIYDIDDMIGTYDGYEIYEQLGLDKGDELTEPEWDEAAYEMRKLCDNLNEHIDYWVLQGYVREAIKRVVAKRSEKNAEK